LVCEHPDDERTIDAEIALNSRISMPFDSPGEGDSDVDLYRVWLRYSSSQFEASAEKTKINSDQHKLRGLATIARLILLNPMPKCRSTYSQKHPCADTQILFP
jgi:hypothetical protein